MGGHRLAVIALSLILLAACSPGRRVTLDGSSAPDGAACTTGLTLCDGECVDTSRDPSHCGGCGQACDREGWHDPPRCVDGACIYEGKKTCGAQWVDLRSSDDHCGACDSACDTTRGFTCVEGACVCVGGMTECNGICVNTLSDNNNCGGCGNACTGGKTCQNGACACPTGLNDCLGICVDLQTDNNNCAACGCGPCFTCYQGTCMGECPPVQIPCFPAPGPPVKCSWTCIDPSTDPNNCGQCGSKCIGGKTCQAGACACPAGETDCSGTCSDLYSDPQSCGSCGSACGAGQACVNGQCA